MPVPTLVTDLSTTLASNSPSGSDNVFPSLDDYLRALSGFVASIRDNSGNGWVSPYLPLTYSAGTANGVVYLNGSKVVTTGSALVFDGTNFSTTGTATATKLIPTGGSATGNGMFLPAANTLGFSTNGTQAMTLDASGDLLVGKTATTNGEKFGVRGSGATSVPTNLSDLNGALALVDCSIGNTAYGAFGFQSAGGGGAAVVLGRGTSYDTNILFCTNPSTTTTSGAMTERARITSEGDLLVGTTSALSARRGIQVLAPTGTYVAGSFANDAGSTAQTIETWNKATTGNNSFVSFATEGTFTERGQITYNRAGGLVVYNTTSDYRAKDIIGPVQNPGATIDALKVYEGKMKGATQSRPMLVAHEAQAVAPYAVTGEKDAVNEDGTPKFQQMDVSSLVPLLLAEIQSLRARVAALEQA